MGQEIGPSSGDSALNSYRNVLITASGSRSITCSRILAGPSGNTGTPYQFPLYNFITRSTKTRLGRLSPPTNSLYTVNASVTRSPSTTPSTIKSSRWL